MLEQDQAAPRDPSSGTRPTDAGAKRRRGRRRIVIALVLGLLLIGIAAMAAPRLLGVRVLRGTRPAAPPRSEAELEARWHAILDGVVRDGVVDYGVLTRRRQALAEHIGVLKRFGPETAPRAFADRDARLAYYINGYNALVVFAVVENRVRRSVHEVRGPLDPIAGMGFFWALRFPLDGGEVSLHALENDLLRTQFGDARLHAAINCASASCPRLADHAYHGATLDAELTEAARRFASEAPHVRIDDDRREIVLSAIYEWYEDDFVAHARALGLSPSVMSWIAHHASRDVRSRLAVARRERYRVRHAPYDWTLNGHF